MKNIFDFATKELSQDAFLRWFIESWDDETVGEASKRFLVQLSNNGKQEPINVDEIVKIETFAQAAHMDVVSDIYLKDKPRVILVIEDKTESSTHGTQLCDYDDTLAKWNVGKDKNRKTFKIYYKTDYLSQKEEDDISYANNRNEQNGHDTKWQILSIEEIADFFKDYTNNENQILSSYALHILNKKKALKDVNNDKPMNKWSLTEAKTYFKKEIVESLKDYSFNLTEYQGRYTSLFCYCSPDSFKGEYEAILEIIFRPGDHITGGIHLVTKGSQFDNWKKTENNPFWEAVGKKFANEKFEGYSPKDIINSNNPHLQTVATFSKKIIKSKVAGTNDGVTNELIKLIETYYEYFSSIK